jgi:hypothetical protein
VTEETGATAVVRQATRNRVLRGAARAGYAISGILHLLVAYIMIRIAFGSGGNADPSGALETIADTAGGVVALWGVAVALIPLALWRVAEALIGLHPAEDVQRAEIQVSDRLKALGLALVYCAVAFTAVRFAVGRRQPTGQQNVNLSARLMRSDWGEAVLVMVGLAIIGIGGYYAYKGAARNFLNDLNVPGGSVLTKLGLLGYVAEGLVLAGSGILVIVATITSEPSKAAGIDATVKIISQTAIGKVVIILAAAGFASYGLYSFALTRCSRM